MFVVKHRLPREHAADAAWCIAFVGYWERSVRDVGAGASIKVNLGWYSWLHLHSYIIFGPALVADVTCWLAVSDMLTQQECIGHAFCLVVQMRIAVKK